MPADHPRAKVKRALVTIVDTDATIVSLCGNRANGNIAQGFLELNTAPPAILFTLIGFDQVGEDRDAREGTIQFTVVADDDDIADALLHRLEQLMTADRFYTAGIDAAQGTWSDRDLPSGPGSSAEEGPHIRTRNYAVVVADLSLTLTV